MNEVVCKYQLKCVKFNTIFCDSCEHNWNNESNDYYQPISHIVTNKGNIKKRW